MEPWKLKTIIRARDALQRRRERERREQLEACLDTWRPFVLRQSVPTAPDREVIQERALDRLLLDLHQIAALRLAQAEARLQNMA